jgi:hypothetical protein
MGRSLDLVEEFMSNMTSSEVSPDEPFSYNSDCPIPIYTQILKDKKQRKCKKIEIGQTILANVLHYI